MNLLPRTNIEESLNRLKTKNIDQHEKELRNLIKIEENRQLNNFSKIYFDKLQINTKINEF